LLVQEVLPKLGDDVVMISIDSDPNEDATLLRKYADQLGFSWRFAVAPREVIASVAQELGTGFLTQPNEPMFVVSAKTGQAHALPFGHKSEEDLRAAVQRYRTS
jgi:cytochrome oxidase Cu insertion factor (SCO1/SenC/PrrC family)